MSSAPILANVATPVFFPQPLLACLALVPIIVIEMCTLRRTAPFRWRDVSIANILSTILGIPVALLSAAVLGAGFGIIVDQLYATLPAVVLFLIVVVVPCFALSVYLEGYYLRGRMKGSWRAGVLVCYAEGPQSDQTQSVVKQAHILIGAQRLPSVPLRKDGFRQALRAGAAVLLLRHFKNQFTQAAQVTGFDLLPQVAGGRG